jgi:hypothetical protein
MREFLLLMSMVVVASAQTNDTEKIRVTGDRVSLRAKPDINSELLDRAMKDDEMVFLGSTNGWLAVQAPESMDLWVAAEYIENGTVQPARLNVRSGPNRNYSVVCVIDQGTAVTPRGEFSEWLKIAPPPGSRVWISEDYAERIEPPAPVPEPAPEPEPAPVAEPKPEPKPAAPAPVSSEKELKPLVLVLDKSRKQGTYDEIPGVLRRANPGLFKLVLITDGFEEPICLVRGNEEQLKRYLDRALLIKGKKYWVVDVDVPVIIPDKIHLDPIIAE